MTGLRAFLTPAVTYAIACFPPCFKVRGRVASVGFWLLVARRLVVGDQVFHPHAQLARETYDQRGVALAPPRHDVGGVALRIAARARNFPFSVNSTNKLRSSCADGPRQIGPVAPTRFSR